MQTLQATTIDEYINHFPKEVQHVMQEVRQAIQQTAPKATEKISYGIPCFVLQGNLIHFAAYKNHIGLYPGAEALVFFKKELTNYKTAKGTVQFPLDAPMPHPLIKKIVKYRIQKNQEKALLKAKKK